MSNLEKEEKDNVDVENFDIDEYMEVLEKNGKQKEDEEYQSVKSDILSWVKTIAAAIIVAVLINNFVIVNASVPTGSMEPTIMTKDRIIAFRWTYAFSDPKRGDIIVFKFPDDETQAFVKRLIGLPGETVNIIDGKVYINDVLLAEPYLTATHERSFGPYVVPEGCYFMLGDNRSNSHDARYWMNTYVTREKILGKAYVRYFPYPAMLK